MSFPVQPCLRLASLTNPVSKRILISQLRQRNFSSSPFLRAQDKIQAKGKDANENKSWPEKSASYLTEARERIRKRNEEREAAEKREQAQLQAANLQEEALDSESREQHESQELEEEQQLDPEEKVPGYLRPVNPLALRPAKPPFRMGLKKVYLPNFEIVLHRNEKLEPYLAVFKVPLNFSKFDLRDYLWNLYGVETLSVRSAVYAGKIKRTILRTRRGDSYVASAGGFRRTSATKKMIVQLAKPFRFPRLMNAEDKDEYVILNCSLSFALHFVFGCG